MTVEKHVQIGKNKLLIGLDFGFGSLQRLERESEFSINDIVDYSNKIVAYSKGEQVEFNEKDGKLLCEITMAVHQNYCDLNDEPVLLTNEAKVLAFLDEVGGAVIFEKVLESLSRHLLKVTGAKDSEVDSKKKKTVRPSPK